MAKLPAAIITGTMASPSRPSVRLTALEEPIITSAPNSGNAKPRGMIRSLNTGTATPVAWRRGAELDQHDGGDQADAALAQQLQPAGQAAARALGELEIVVGEADQPVAQGDDQHDPDIAVAQVRPEQRGRGQRQQDQHAAHGGRALLGQQVALGPVQADRLALALLPLQPADQGRADQEADQERRHHRAAGAEGDVADDVEGADLVREREEQAVEHQAAFLMTPPAPEPARPIPSMPPPPAPCGCRASP